MCTFKCSIYPHVDTNANFSTSWDKMEYSALYSYFLIQLQCTVIVLYHTLDTPLYKCGPSSVVYLSHRRGTNVEHNEKRCCYITVDSATAALQNGACTYRCISKQMHYKTPLSHNGYTWKVWKFMKTTSVCPVWKKTNFLQYYINSEPYMAYYPKWLK